MSSPSFALAPTDIDAWATEHAASFAPPVCNKLLHRAQLSVMFVGGPNARTDFHLDQASEFFYQLRGTLLLPTVQRGRRKLVTVPPGHVYLLPSRVPHSPQRPDAASLGFVLERRRLAGELDGLRWYTDFDRCDRVLWEKYFQCFDLGRDLVPVVHQFLASPERASGEPSSASLVAAPPFQLNSDVDVPDPFPLDAWLDAHAAELAAGAVLPLFPGHPDGEINVRVCGGPAAQAPPPFEFETLLWQLRGACRVRLGGGGGGGDAPWHTLAAGVCAVVPAGVAFEVERDAGSVGWWITQDPCGNNADNRALLEAEAAQATIKTESS
jgi:3-hydroxyanthranilate 3,4-dioxygenase